MKIPTKYLRYFLYTFVAFALTGIAGLYGLYAYLAPKLPPIDSLKDVQLQVPLRVYTHDGVLIAEYGEMKRIPLNYDQFPPAMVQAILAAEDSRFFEHPGVDYQGLLRAAVNLAVTGERGQGGSTITMQVARNFFLSREKTYSRKLNEILLSLKIEDELSKEDILSLYLNKIFLGHRAYGVAAAAQVYYGKELAELNLAQFAMIAGLPKAPSAYNPIANPDRALQRRNYVLRRMRDLNFIDETQYQEAAAATVTASLHTLSAEVEAPYVAEMVRSEMLERFGKDAYTSGLKAYTTIEAKLQRAANTALHNNLIAYEHRHGYRGPEGHQSLPEQAGAEEWATALDGQQEIGGLQPALVVALAQDAAVIYLRDGVLQVLPWEGMSWAQPYIDDNTLGKAPESTADLLKVGDIIRVERNSEGIWQLAQVPNVSSALVSLRPYDGALLALVGGFDFFHSKFNRATQAQRQPGSNFKPFIYSAALENGFTLASIINDAPVVFDDIKLESEWRPENYSGKFYGPTRLREALVNSRNLVSIRLLQSVGIKTAIQYVSRFGFDPGQLSRDLSLALGSASITPYDLVRGYSVFANGGYLVNPYYIAHVEDSDGKILYQAEPLLACDDCAEKSSMEPNVDEQSQATDSAEIPSLVSDAPPPEGSAEEIAMTPPAPKPAPRVAEARNVYLVTSMMQDVIRHGTGAKAMQLGRNDLAGKTGTTNDQQDAWFSGFNHDVVTTVWVGFDTPRSLGSRETGARAALPMWIDYMREALKDSPQQLPQQPEGIASVRIDAETGAFTTADNPNAIFELFRVENLPAPGETIAPATTGDSDGSTITEDLF